MSESDQLAALLGRRQLALDNLNNDYLQLLQVLDRLVKNEYRPEWVTVDLFARSWRVDIPAEPAVTNGKLSNRISEFNEGDKA